MRMIVVGGLLAAAVGGGLVVARNMTASPAAADPIIYQVAPDAQSASRPRRFTKDEFASFTHGKTKAEIKAAFGAPESVSSLTDADAWLYPYLPIYDADAGTHAGVFVQFPKGQDFVDEVKFY